ncbi:hypothetical protein MRX96_026132 [Rhipicephalus microplus]
MNFKVDTGADVTAIPTSLYNEQVMGNLKQAKKQLLGPGRTEIATIGLFSATLCWNGRECQEEIYVIDKLHDALLGRPAIKSSEIFPSLLEVTASTSKRRRMVLGQATARKFQRCQESIDKDSSAYSLRPL